MKYEVLTFLIEFWQCHKLKFGYNELSVQEGMETLSGPKMASQKNSPRLWSFKARAFCENRLVWLYTLALGVNLFCWRKRSSQINWKKTTNWAETPETLDFCRKSRVEDVFSQKPTTVDRILEFSVWIVWLFFFKNMGKILISLSTRSSSLQQ